MLFLLFLVCVSLVELWSALPSILALMEVYAMLRQTVVCALGVLCIRQVDHVHPPARIHFPQKGPLKDVSALQDCS